MAINVLVDAQGSFAELKLLGIQSIRLAGALEFAAAALNISSGTVYCLSVATSQVQHDSFGEVFWTNLAVSRRIPDSCHRRAGLRSRRCNRILQPLRPVLNTNVYPVLQGPDDSGVLGPAYSPGGKALVMPLDSIEIWNTATGTLLARLMTPEELQKLVYPEGAVAPMIALDSTGQTIFAASASGITVIELPAPLDQMPDRQWPAFPLSVKAPQSSGYHLLSARIAALEKSSNSPGSRGSIKPLRDNSR